MASIQVNTKQAEKLALSRLNRDDSSIRKATECYIAKNSTKVKANVQDVPYSSFSNDVLSITKSEARIFLQPWKKNNKILSDFRTSLIYSALKQLPCMRYQTQLALGHNVITHFGTKCICQ